MSVWDCKWGIGRYLMSFGFYYILPYSVETIPEEIAWDIILKDVATETLHKLYWSTCSCKNLEYCKDSLYLFMLLVMHLTMVFRGMKNQNENNYL